MKRTPEPHPLSLAAVTASVAWWNRNHGAGSVVRVRRGNGAEHEGTCGAAYLHGGCTPVVEIDGVPGKWALMRVEVVTEGNRA